MYVTACLAGQKVDVEVGEECRTLQALKESIVEELPQLCVEGFDVSVGGRALDDDEGVVSLESAACLDVSANSCGLSVLALREAGHEVSEAGLLAAAAEGDVALCTLYLDAGVPVDCVGDEGNIPLFVVCSDGNANADATRLSLATLLLDRGSAIDTYGETPLHAACARGRLSLVTLLLDRGSAAIDNEDDSCHTPLHYSVKYEHVEVATLLLDRGSAIDTPNMDGVTPLHTACARGRLSLVTLLLDRGSAAIDDEDESCHTPLHYSVKYDHVEVATLLLDRGSTAVDMRNYSSETPLHNARGALMATLLLDRGSTAIDAKDAQGGTPLHSACRRGDVAVATVLLDRGSTAIDVQDDRGEKPLYDACRSRNVALATLLLDRGCSFDVEWYKSEVVPYEREFEELLRSRGHNVN